MPGTACWSEVMPHIAQRAEWTDPELSVKAFTAPGADPAELAAALAEADLLVAVGVSDEGEAAALAASSAGVPTVLAMDCAPALGAATRLLFQPASALLGEVARLVPWSAASRDASILASATELYGRDNPNDLLYMILVVVDYAVAKLPVLAGNKETGLKEIGCMVSNCRGEIIDCVTDPTCKAALDCLTGCGLNDQVCSYRCIVSYESPKFEQFSLCNLQKHNCLGNHAERPALPDVRPIETFRGEPLTHEAAEGILGGWLGGEKPWSWLVVCGQNPAYDFFPCQHQLFYRGKGSAFWYDPVFKVTTLAGEETWRRRHYRVKRADAPGTFTFSVLDNGVTSLEYWRIAACAEDLSWALFYYSGAASAAGTAYAGAVFVTPDGAWPEREALPAVEEALGRCGMKLWELYEVDNSRCAGAPLGSEAEA